jgi:hypothetical protein
MGFKIDNAQSSVFGQSPPSVTAKISPKNDSFSHNDVNVEKKIPVKNKSYEEAKVDLKSFNPIIELLNRIISAIKYK